jgi:Ca-activated chloride channel family protein
MRNPTNDQRRSICERLWHRPKIRAATAALSVACGCALLAAQQAVFRTDTDLVSIFATVTDGHRRLVRNLSAEDFEVLDNGTLQPLAFFANASQPMAIVVLLDTGAATTLEFETIRDAAEQFVIRLLPADQARICAFNDRIQFAGEFSNDRDALIREVQAIDFGNGSRLYDALEAAIDTLKDIDRRRAILLFSTGRDGRSKTKLRTVVERAQAEDVMVYAIGVAGREFDDDEDEFVDREPDGRLEKLAADTGGAYFQFDRSRDVGRTFTRVAEELHSQYVLGFTPPTADGRVHKVSVRLKEGRFKVRARRHYLAPLSSSLR